MEFILDQLARETVPGLFSLVDILLAMTVSALLAYVLAQVYRSTHRGTSYARSYLLTLFLMAVTTSVVMIIIGSNIARAFSLVGALSIVRFRTAVKDARDTGFLFAAVVVGMACGTQFYASAIALTAFLGALVLTLHWLDYGFKNRPDSIVRITYRRDSNFSETVEPLLKSAFRRPQLLNRMQDFEQDFATNVYSVHGVDDAALARFESQVREQEGVVQVAVFQKDQDEES